MVSRFLKHFAKIDKKWTLRSQFVRCYCEKPKKVGSYLDVDTKKIIYPMSISARKSATVTEVYNLSKTVRGLKLQVHDDNFSFRSGQWVDFIVPELTKIAGYSICTSPEYFGETNQIELAVKYSTFPPTKWVHEQCVVGSNVDVALGGQFYFDYNTYLSDRMLERKCNDQTDEGKLLLIAGGVGINPLISILRHIARNSEVLEQKIRVLLLYCASSDHELIFKDKICDLASRHQNISCEFLVTTVDAIEEHIRYVSPRIYLTTSQRLNEKSLKKRINEHFNGCKQDLMCYLCGPNEMIDDLSKALHNIGVPQNMVKYEKWW